MKQITFNCPACDHPLTVPASAADLSGPCPECGEIITGPGLRTDAPPEPAVIATPPESRVAPKPDPEPVASPTMEDREPAQAEPPATPPTRQFGPGAVAVLLLLSSVACFSLGYQLGRNAGSTDPQHAKPPDPRLPTTPRTGAPDDATVPPGPAPAPAPNRPEPTPPGTTTTPKPAPAPVTPTNPAPNEDLSPEKTALLTFLSAADWTARRDLVLHGAQVAPRMKALAAKLGDGPITPTRVAPMHRTAQSVVFEVATAEHPNGFPVALRLVNDRWLVDWESFAEFHYKVFPSFISDETRSTGTFRLLIKPELAGVGDTGRQPYSAGAPGMEEPVTIYAAEGSGQYQALEDIIGALAAKAPIPFRQLMASGGIPLVLELSKTVEDGQTIIMVNRIVDRGWSPRAPAPNTP